MKNLNLILLVGFFALSCAMIFVMSYGFRMVQMKCFIEPELTAATLFLICFGFLMFVNGRLKPKTPTPITDKPVLNNGETEPQMVDTPPTNPENTNLVADLAAEKTRSEDLEKGLKRVEAERDALQKERDVLQKERDVFKDERDINEKYFTCLDKRYEDLLETARITDEKDPAAITHLWRILISLGLHQYDYMKKICDDDNWRPEQAANIRLVLDEIKVGALQKEEYKIYTDDPRYIATDFRVLRRRLHELGIEQLDDVLISGVRI